jgi:flagella basal body P-ring formation protein FlgA
MRRGLTLLTILFAAALSSLAGIAWAGPPAIGRGIVISLRPSSEVSGRYVLLSHVARVDANDPVLKSILESLDLAPVPPSGETAVVSAKLVEYRLKLAGIDPRLVLIQGDRSQVTASDAQSRSGITQAASHSQPRAVRPTSYIESNSIVESSQERPQVKAGAQNAMPSAVNQMTADGGSLQEAVVAVARKAVLEQLPWSENEVTIRLVQPIQREIRAFEDSHDCVCTAVLRASGSPVGRVNVDVTVRSPDQAPAEIPVTLEVRHFATVASTARAIPRGRKIQNEDLYLRRWDVTGLTDYCTEPDKLIGRTATRPLRAAEILRDQDLDRTPAESGDRPVVIKRSNRLKIVARIGDLQVTVAGEAMQDGRLGETIKVQNVESKTIVQGKVIAADEVEITY